MHVYVQVIGEHGYTCNGRVGVGMPTALVLNMPTVYEYMDGVYQPVWAWLHSQRGMDVDLIAGRDHASHVHAILYGGSPLARS